MKFIETLQEELHQNQNLLREATVLVGLDGFIDKIVHPIDKRHGKGNYYTPIKSISAFGKRISDAAGKSTNIELAPVIEKLGGNGPIMSEAMRQLGQKVCYVGALGKPEIHPLFSEFAKNTQAISLSDPGVTHALEFQDGKVMLGSMSTLEEIHYQAVVDNMGEGAFLEKLDQTQTFALVNWTMIPNMSDFFHSLITDVYPNLGPSENRRFFFDLADPEKRSDNDLETALDLISKFQSFGAVSLGLNYKESLRIYKLMGYNSEPDTESGLIQIASRIRDRLKITCVVIHTRKSAACATSQDTAFCNGPYCTDPKISTGAGDHFNAGFMTASRMQLSPSSCIVFAASVSGYYVRNGKSPNLNQVDQFLDLWKKNALD